MLPGVSDALNALLVAEAGFGAAFVSGFAVAGSLLGEPDVGLLNQTEVADVARRVCAAAPELAVVVDADTGYGDERSVQRTVQLWEQAGAAGMFLEDQVWPKRCGHMAGKAVVETAEWLAKLEAALESRTHLHVTARTDARAVYGLDAALERAGAAAALGVDAIFVEAPEDRGELETIAEELSGFGGTLVANMVEFGRSPLLSTAELGEMGFDLVISPLTTLLSATAAMRSALGELAREGTTRGHLHHMTSFDDFTAIVGLDHH
jgi:2-methylisocitrate lyase-like PEP mutase family enzyme